MSIRDRIREWLNITGPNFDARFEAINNRLDEQARDIQALRNRRRDTAYAPLVVTDWETAQVAFMNDPKNFEQGKEN